MKTPAERIARIQADAEFQKQVFDLLKHPVFSVVMAFVIIETLQKVKLDNQPLMGENVGFGLEAALTLGPFLTSLANSKVVEGLITTMNDSKKEIAQVAVGMLK